MKPTVQVMENGAAAVHAVRDWNQRGYRQDQIYVLSHENDATKRIADTAEANEIGIAEEGVVQAMANLFRSRGDELRAKLESVGLTEQEAEHYEEELDKGRVLVIIQSEAS